jgi:uncharacterized protein (DUF2344 family)
MEEFIIYKQIEKNLISLFHIECPEKNNSIMTKKDDVLKEFKKWMDFWVSKNPHITDPNIDMNKNKLLFIKKQICEMKIVGIFKELEEIGLCKEFKEKYCN